MTTQQTLCRYFGTRKLGKVGGTLPLSYEERRKFTDSTVWCGGFTGLRDAAAKPPCLLNSPSKPALSVEDSLCVRLASTTHRPSAELPDKRVLPNPRRTNSLQHGRFLSGRIVRQTRAEVRPYTPLWFRGFESPLSASQSLSDKSSADLLRNHAQSGQFSYLAPPETA